MKLRQWPTRRIAWLWFAVVLYMGALVAFGALRTRQQRASLAKRDGWVPDTATATHLTSAQRAQRDSLLDSLMHIAEQYLNSPDGHKFAQDVYVVIGQVGADARRDLLIALAVLLTPAAGLGVLTLVWYRRRTVPDSAAGA